MSQIDEAIKTLRSKGGFCPAPEFGLIEIYGKDAQRFLQAQTTNDVASLGQSGHQQSCVLDRKAKIKAVFDLYRRHDSFRIIAYKQEIKTVLECFEQHKVADKVDFLDISSTGQFFTVQGPDSRKLIRSGMHGSLPGDHFCGAVSDVKLFGISVHMFALSITGEDGFFLWVTNSDADALYDKLKHACLPQGLTELSKETLNVARIEAGLPLYGFDFNSEDFLPETGLDQSTVSYTKGCFVGQEVLARVKGQGAPTRGLTGLLFDPGASIKLEHNSKIIVDGEEAGQAKSNTFSPTLNRTVAFFSAKREFRVPDKQLSIKINGAAHQTSVALLPFYKAAPLKERSRSFYEEALLLYPKEGDDQAETSSVSLLRQAIDLDPSFEDAYEALGVILSKRDRLDEAIELMRRLAQMNVDSAIAHTNLSVFYMQKGLKDEAEEEKAISMSIRMRLAASQMKADKEAVGKKEQEKTEALERLEMFKQVLEIDSQDLLANYGLGTCYITLREFEKALVYLNKAISVKPSYTMAYVSLGQAYEELNRMPDAIAALEKGIEVAASRGDMTPLNNMQQRLSALKAKV